MSKNPKQPAAPEATPSAELPDLSKLVEGAAADTTNSESADIGAAGTPNTDPVTGLTAKQEADQLELERAQIERMEAEEKQRAEAEKAPAPAPAVGGKTPQELAAAAAEARAAIPARYYVTVGDSKLTDPSTLLTFSHDKAQKSKLTGWLEYQIAHGKIKRDEE